jgi:spore maturation protein CgeB
MVFGDEGWVTSGAIDRSQWGGPVAPADLPGLYARSRLNLNFNFMQVSSTVNPKVLDVAAAGGAVLTDDRPELAELFPSPDVRPFVFTTLAELPDRVSSLLRRDLDSHRRGVREEVIAHHTMHHRADWLIRELSLPVTRSAEPISSTERIRMLLG